MTSLAKELLFEKYLDFQRDHKEVKTMKDFAVYCKVSETYMNLLMNGRRSISPKMAVHLAQILDEPRFYDLVHSPHPDETFKYMSSNWSGLTPDQHKALQQQAAEYLAENKQNGTQGNHEAAPCICSWSTSAWMEITSRKSNFAVKRKQAGLIMRPACFMLKRTSHLAVGDC
jgi:transcriptional regulator with XRE-family HTH domain